MRRNAILDSSAFRIKGIGIDLISLKRISRLLSGGKLRVASKCLTHSEERLWRSKGSTRKLFAQLFSAKEAAFKALGGSWLSFQDLEVQCLPESQFLVNFSKLKAREFIQGSFFGKGSILGAQALYAEGK